MRLHPSFSKETQSFPRFWILFYPEYLNVHARSYDSLMIPFPIRAAL